ncbi:KiSS-1 receptor [Strongyloides ratti]|uniref:KiSS-1 receptor n=1 Tax=Strongyloides ratti TaxID=34506 RepID=A0A090LVA9_STRRB|nr:KiSS-1 receptor [Strongyloides ratti]CEF71599.1 KiSS-1 receptor [Strongyloides ratti]
MDNFTKNDALNFEFYTKFIEPFESQKNHEKYIMYCVVVLFSLIIIIGLFGNLCVIFIACEKKMRNSTNTLIIGLAFSDLMFLIFCVPITTITYISQIWILPIWICKLVYYLQHTSAYSSVWTLTLMAVDRYLAVCYPIRSISIRNSRNALLTLIIIYSIILISQIHIASGHGIYHYNFIFENRSTCAMERIAYGTASLIETRIYYFSFNIFGYLIPLIITCILYFYMLRRLWHSSKRFSGKLLRHKNGIIKVKINYENYKSKKKATKLILIVVIIWAFCWLPFNIVLILSGIVYPNTITQLWGKNATICTVGAQILAYANSCLNPILYALISESYRKGFIKIVVYILKIGRLSPTKWCISQLNDISIFDVSKDRSINLNANSRNRPSCTSSR